MSVCARLDSYIFVRSGDGHYDIDAHRLHNNRNRLARPRWFDKPSRCGKVPNVVTDSSDPDLDRIGKIGPDSYELHQVRVMQDR